MQRFVGIVVGTKSAKTAKVCVERLVLHKYLKELVPFRKNYLVHDETEVARVGDLVSIRYAGHKISTRKAFNLIEVIKKAQQYQHPITRQIYTIPVPKAPACVWTNPTI